MSVIIMFGRRFRAQSAMEYLMTYGWAILIIAVVLGELFSLGVFNGSSLLGTSCVALSGYYCSTPVLSHSNGDLLLTIGQATGNTYTSVTAYAVRSGTVFSSSDPSNAIGTITSGQTVPITIALNGGASNYTIGTPYTGYIYLVYSMPSASGLTSEVATISVKAS